MVTLKKVKKRIRKTDTFIKVLDENSKVIRKYDCIFFKNEDFFLGKKLNKYLDICSFKTGKILLRFNTFVRYIKFISKNYALIQDENLEYVLINLSVCKDNVEIFSISDLENIEGVMRINDYININDDLILFITTEHEFLLFDKQVEYFTKVCFDGTYTFFDATYHNCYVCDNFIVLELSSNGSLYFNVIELHKSKFIFDHFIKGSVKSAKIYNYKLYIITYNYSLIDETGKTIIDERIYTDIRFIESKPFIELRNRNRFGLAKITGEIIFEAKYKEIIELPDKFVVEEFPTKEYQIIEYNI